ncbi:MAG TPA: N-acetyl-gamma-glutamyl-phosphate reductase [Vicinamibacterales bacterium]|jgi:N-acetyl-gamma-glutamyl-phosphate reductase|nr:N-acetyl-gamma-glutamyl-phosphate reductase [Vicinamibacterales bacterium]
MNNYSSVRVGVAGATGYAGLELLRRLARHPHVDLRFAMASSASEAKRLPALARIWDAPVEPLDVNKLGSEADAVFLALPDTLAAEIVPALADRGARVFDLSGAFRLRDVALRQRWYPHTGDTSMPIVYGLTERRRLELASARLVACPGCYPTAAVLALQPLVAASLVEPGIVIDAKSGVSGAGKTPTERTHFSECHGSISAYGVFAHRHAAEIEQELGTPVTFVPHLVPLDRGIFETIYARLRAGVDEAAVAAALTRAYADSPFVRLTGGDLPEIKHVAHTNFCDIGWRVQGQQLVMVACIDNLVKGAAGQAIQNFNVVFGFDEATGLN